LKNKNSSGYDEITTKIIKISKLFIISPIINICNKMLAQGIYPERWKCSLIRPVYKSGAKSSPSNYRPIFLLPALSNIFEKVIYKRLFDHFNNNAVMNEHQ
jgi:hypothetical protein